jgi:hypothetical protein
MDWKFDHPPSEENISLLEENDWLKFVCSNIYEIVEALYIIGGMKKRKFNVAISATDTILYETIVGMVERTDKRVVINVQIHKLIGVD